MPKLVDLYLQLKTEAAIYTDGTVESIISVRALLLLDRDWK
jgi:hypothetical protein